MKCESCNKNDSTYKTSDGAGLCTACWADLLANDPSFGDPDRLISWKEALLLFWHEDEKQMGRPLSDEEKAESATNLMNATLNNEIPNYRASDN